MERKTHKVLGYDVDLMTFDDALLFTENKLKNNEGLHVVTINPEIIEHANKDETFAPILRNADLVIPDGIGIKIALKLQGIQQEQIPGIEFAKELIGICEKNNKSIALIGAKEEVIQKAKNNLLNEYKNLNICYSRNGYFTNEEIEKIITELESNSPSVVLVALGAPKQDLFIQQCKKKLQNTIYVGVGGSFDVWAGVVERAPEFYRKIGCEWLYRTMKQPQRLKRIYKTLPLFLFKAIIEATKK